LLSSLLSLFSSSGELSADLGGATANL
jgi:hypothetical protein